jgi:hypothetical protein
MSSFYSDTLSTVSYIPSTLLRFQYLAYHKYLIGLIDISQCNK